MIDEERRVVVDVNKARKGRVMNEEGVSSAKQCGDHATLLIG